jgi:hypothetical protein
MMVDISATRWRWLFAITCLIATLSWLDQTRGGPASLLSRCNLLLTRDHSPSADILLIGSSRTGTAIDPIAMQQLLTHAMLDREPRVERIAIGNNPLRLSNALLDNYLTRRGTPELILLEVMFQTRRSIDRLAQGNLDSAPEHKLFLRDLNLMTFRQILTLPSIAMPYTENEGFINLWHYRLRGAALRSGALAYQFLKNPAQSWDLASCDHTAWTQEPDWPSDFSFSMGDFQPDRAPESAIRQLNSLIRTQATSRPQQPWQQNITSGRPYPYDFENPYRMGEVTMLKSIVTQARDRGIPVLLLPLPLYGYHIASKDLNFLQKLFEDNLHVLDLYKHVPADLDRFWYDDAHLEPHLAGAITTSVLARHLIETGLVTNRNRMNLH